MRCQPVDAFLTDLRYAYRQLRKAPLFSCVAIATLAIGIGASTAIFSTVNATLLRPLPFPHADQLVDVHTRLIDGRVTTGLLSSVVDRCLERLTLDRHRRGRPDEPAVRGDIHAQ